MLAPIVEPTTFQLTSCCCSQIPFMMVPASGLYTVGPSLVASFSGDLAAVVGKLQAIKPGHSQSLYVQRK